MSSLPLPPKSSTQASCNTCSSSRKRKALVVAVDGLRADSLLLTANPFLRRLLLSRKIAYTFHAKCDETPVSYPSWCNTFTGRVEEEHGILSNDDPTIPKVKSVIKLLKEAKGKRDKSFTSSCFIPGWFGFRNIFGGEGNTFEHNDLCGAPIDIDNFQASKPPL